MNDAVDQVLGDGFGGTYAAVHLAQAAVQRAAAHAHIDLRDASVHHTLQVLEDAVDAALDIFDILHDTIPDTVQVPFLLQMLYTQVSSRGFLGNGSNNLRASDFKCYNVLVLFHKTEDVL